MRSLILLSAVVSALNNGFARTPQMGWNNWNSLGCNVSEELVIDTAHLMVKLGLYDSGYNYVLLDDCWSAGRFDGKLKESDKFPHGMKWLADEIHALGLLYGMYSSAGTMTCGRYEGSLDHETEDAETFLSWGVDYLKYDNCFTLARHGTPEASFNRYKVMSDALQGKMLYSLCNWGEDMVHYWGSSIANSWRISGDIYDSFARPDALCSCTDSVSCSNPGSQCSVLAILNRVAPYADKGSPGGWQDLDMLEVGHGGMTEEEYKAHFALWAALKSPLIIGADLRHLEPSALAILTNPAIIALNQDPLGIPANRVFRGDGPKDRYGIGEVQIWAGPLSEGDQVVILLNAANEAVKMTAYLEDIFSKDGPGGSAPHNSISWDVHDLWADWPSDVSSTKGQSSSEKFNSRETSYAEALKSRDKRLLGKKIGEIQPFGSWKVKVERHSAKVYRLIPHDVSKVSRYSTTKDEL